MFNNIFLSLFFILVSLTSTQSWALTNLIPSKYVKVDGKKIAVYESKGKKGPGILLVHGNTSSSYSYLRFIASPFAKKNRVVSMDLPGFGRSQNRASYTTQNFRNAIVAVAKATGVDDGVIVGWSLGGDLVLQSAPSLPDAKGFFIFGTAPLGGAPATAPYPFLMPNESYAGNAVTYGTTAQLSPSQVRDYVDAFFAPNYNAPHLLYWEGYRADGDTRAAVANAAMGLDPTFLPEVIVAQNLTVPLAMIHTEHDAFVRYDYLQAIESTFPTLWTGQTVFVPGYGHALHWESPTKFSNLFNDFFYSL